MSPQLRTRRSFALPPALARIRLTPPLFRFPIPSLFFFSQLRSPFPLAYPFPVLASPVCRPFSRSPAAPPGSAALRFPVPWMPRTQPAARSQGRDCLQFSVLRSPSLTPPHHLPPLRSGFGYIWVESRTQACPCRPLPGSPPALRSQVNVSQRAKGAPRLPPLPRRQAPLQALRSSFPGRPRSVFRSLGSGGLAWAPVTYPSLRPGSRPGSSSHLASGPPPLQPPADAPPPPVAAPSPAPAVFTRGGRGGAGGPGGSANQRLSGSEKGWWREEEAVRDG